MVCLLPLFQLPQQLYFLATECMAVGTACITVAVVNPESLGGYKFSAASHLAAEIALHYCIIILVHLHLKVPLISTPPYSCFAVRHICARF